MLSSLPSLPKYASPSASNANSDGTQTPKQPPSEKDKVEPFPYNNFLIPRGSKEPVGQIRKITLWTKWQLFFNTYRKLFTFVVAINFVGLVLAALDIWKYPRNYTGAVVLGNILVAVLVRNELFIRILYIIVNACFAKWPPLWFRLGCTSVLQHLGGIHSGCATSGFVWLIFRLVLIFLDHANYNDAILVMGVLTNFAIAISVASGVPWVRNTHHNVFERFHRFFGWIGLLFTWIFVILGDNYNLQEHSWIVNGIRVPRQQDFWFCVGMTTFISIPWFTIRRVPVEIEIPSSKVAVIKFERGMQQGLLARISRSSILEYHLFGIISEGRHSKYHYLITGVQGDFTKSLVNNPPTHLWTRQLKFPGISNTSTLYKRGIRICTGTGLGSALATCIQNPNWFLIWIGSDQQKTFGSTITNLIHKHIPPERMVLWDSKERGGRPDVVPLVLATVRDFQAEVVFITSNYQGNTELMEGCKQAGVPVFGTLWDF